jgi:hypothetical protein
VATGDNVQYGHRLSTVRNVLSWNNGFADYLPRSAYLIDEAKRWVECAMSIARLQPGSSASSEKVGEQTLVDKLPILITARRYQTHIDVFSLVLKPPPGNHSLQAASPD